MPQSAENVRKPLDRVLVTGATGFLGRAVASALEHAGCSVRRGARAPAADAQQAWTVYGDVGPETRWDEALDGIDAVVHLAGLAHLPEETAAAAHRLHRINVLGTERLAQAAVRCGVRRLVLISSALVHGASSPGRPLTEDDAPAPETAYARSKLESERRLAAAAARSGMEWVVLRPPMVYGPGAGGNFRRLVQLVRAGLPLPLGAATAPRSFIGIDNLADAVVRAVAHPRAHGRAVLVADAETTSTLGLVRLIADGLGRRARTLYVPPAILRLGFGALGRARDVQRLLDPLELDCSVACSLLEWSPPVPLNEGVRRAVAGEVCEKRQR